MTTTTLHSTLASTSTTQACPSQTPLFSPGQIVATPGALEAMEANQCLPLDLLQRHLTGDYGALDSEDIRANQEALVHGLRLLSNYPLANGQRIWIITEADRSATTLLLPDEY